MGPKPETLHGLTPGDTAPQSSAAATPVTAPSSSAAPLAPAAPPTPREPTDPDGKQPVAASSVAAPAPAATAATAASTATPSSIATSSRSIDETDVSGEEPRLSGWDIAFVVAFWVGLGVIFTLVSSSRRSWLVDHWVTMTIGLAVVLAVLALLHTTGWAKTQGASTRAAVLLLLGYPLLVLMLASVFFVLPATQQLIAMRGVVLVALSITPALLWWLFLATQRASLLNEFVANLHRLGLLDAWCIGGNVETKRARSIRVSGYLQRFEATYGRLPASIHKNILSNSAEPYSAQEARDSVPLATAAVPVFLTIVVFSVGWLLTLPPIDTFPPEDASPRWLLALSPNATPVTMTFLGAYFFSLQMLFRRYVRGDLRGSAYVAVVLRVVLAIIGIWVIEATGSMSTWQTRPELLLLAFIVGVFPVVVWQIIRNVGTSLFQVVLPTLKSSLPLAELDGLTVWHESRLEEEDIENVPNMATADIVDLLVNTRFPVNRVIDWVDQAILLTHLGPSEAVRRDPKSTRNVLARRGIRTASALLKATHEARQAKNFDEFSAILSTGDGPSLMPALLAALRTNSNLALVMRWRGLESI